MFERTNFWITQVVSDFRERTNGIIRIQIIIIPPGSGATIAVLLLIIIIATSVNFSLIFIGVQITSSCLCVFNCRGCRE